MTSDLKLTYLIFSSHDLGFSVTENIYQGALITYVNISKVANKGRISYDTALSRIDTCNYLKKKKKNPTQEHTKCQSHANFR